MRVDSNDGSDAELIRAAGADAPAFGVLYERHALQVHRRRRRTLERTASAAESSKARKRRRT